MMKNLNKEIQILINKFQVGDFKNIIEKCSLLLKKNPNNDFLWNLAGLSFQRINDHKNAILSFNKALAANSKNYSAKNNLAISFKNTKEYGRANEILTNLIKEKPDYINALVNLGNLKNDTYYFEDAITFYSKAIKLKKDLPELFLNISNILQIKNDMKAAKENLYEALKIQENFTIADQNLSMLLDYKDEQNNEHLDSMLNKLNNAELKDEQKLHLHFGLGKAYSDKKDYNNSFEHYKIGNGIKIKNKKTRIDYYKKLSNDLKEYFQKLNFEKIKKYNDDGNKIFILGLPRSGTTLLEKIISSHPKVTSVSEINYIHDTINKNVIENDSLDEDKADKFLDTDLNQKFDEFLKFFNINNDFLIDKTLSNFWYIGFIKVYFPNSKIIHSFRNPKDNCLSIYKNLFLNDETWLYSQKDIGEYFLIYNDLMKFWNKLFKGQIFNNKYEDLVNDPETNTKKLIKFCGLQWDDKCLNHHQQKNPIRTLSINQANKPIYKTSINSSKYFETQLSELYSIISKLS